MNMRSAPRHFYSRLTGKYQATIPEANRAALGLKTGDLVSFTFDEQGNIVLRRSSDDMRHAQQAERLSAGIREARRKFGTENALLDGMTSDEWLALMRGPPAEVGLSIRTS